MAIRYPAQRTVSTTTADLRSWITRWEQEVVAEYNSDPGAYESMVHDVLAKDVGSNEMQQLALAVAYLGILREGGLRGDREHFPNYSHGVCPCPYSLSLVLEPRVSTHTMSVALDDNHQPLVAPLGWQCSPDSSPLVVSPEFQGSPDPSTPVVPRKFQWSPDLSMLRHQIVGAHCTVITDHQALRWLMTHQSPNGRLKRWALKLQEYNLTIEYRPGAINYTADA